VLELLGLGSRRGDHEEQLQSGRGDLDLCTAQHGEEVGVAEEAVLALGDEERDRVAAPRHQGARRSIGGVADVVRSLDDRVARLLADVARPAQHTAGGRPGHAGSRSHDLEGRRPHGSAIDPDHVRHLLPTWRAV